MNLADNIRYLRTKNGYSQDEIASLLGYKSFTTIQKWESGVSEPPLNVLIKLSELFHHTLMDLTLKNIEQEETAFLNSPVLCAGGNSPDEPDEKFQEALAYVYQTIREIRSREEADRLNRTVMLFGKLDDVDKERIIERMETMLEGEKYKK